MNKTKKIMSTITSAAEVTVHEIPTIKITMVQVQEMLRSSELSVNAKEQLQSIANLYEDGMIDDNELDAKCYEVLFREGLAKEE